MINTNLTEEEFNRRFDEAMMETYDKYFFNSPVKTGFLRSMIKVYKTVNGFVVEVTEVPYAI